jgi:hypothetical protein
MRAQCMCVKNWCVHCWAYESGTNAYTEHSRQELICALSAVLSKHAEHTCQEHYAYPEHTGQELMHILSIRVRNYSVHWAQSFQNMLSIRVRNIMRTLSIRVRNWCVCSVRQELMGILSVCISFSRVCST